MLTGRFSIAEVKDGTRLGDHMVDTILAGRCLRYTSTSVTDLYRTTFSIVPLPPALFPNFPAFSSHRAHERLVERPFAIHYNWIVGAAAKVAAMKEKGQWFVGAGTSA